MSKGEVMRRVKSGTYEIPEPEAVAQAMVDRGNRILDGEESAYNDDINAMRARAAHANLCRWGYED